MNTEALIKSIIRTAEFDKKYQERLLDILKKNNPSDFSEWKKQIEKKEITSQKLLNMLQSERYRSGTTGKWVEYLWEVIGSAIEGRK